MHCEKCNVTHVMCDITNTIWHMTSNKCNVTIAMWQMHCDKCNAKRQRCAWTALSVLAVYKLVCTRTIWGPAQRVRCCKTSACEHWAVATTVWASAAAGDDCVGVRVRATVLLLTTTHSTTSIQSNTSQLHNCTNLLTIKFGSTATLAKSAMPQNRARNHYVA